MIERSCCASSLTRAETFEFVSLEYVMDIWLLRGCEAVDQLGV